MTTVIFFSNLQKLQIKIYNFAMQKISWLYQMMKIYLGDQWTTAILKNTFKEHGQ